jgi:hypothetical protein
MLELSNNNQQSLNNCENIIAPKDNTPFIKKIICFLLLMFIIVIALLIILNYTLYESFPSDYSIKARYHYLGGSIELYSTLPKVKNLKIWVNGNVVSNNDRYYYGTGDIEVYFKMDISDCTSLSGMFQYTELESITFTPHFNTSNIEDMSNLFYYCSNLK